MILPISVPPEIDQWAIPDNAEQQIAASLQQIEAFQDRWDRPQIEQFVAADFRHLYQTLLWIQKTQPLIGNRFLEWGCGFAVVASIADQLGFDSIGVESEKDLLAKANQTLLQWDSKVELIRGNFLPDGSGDLADDPMLPSLGHDAPSAYRQLGLDLDDFALVYDYPWPGEDTFHEAVFDRYAAPGAMLLLFCGPNDIRLWRKHRNN